MVFGSGCFWGRQYDFITEVEQKLLKRNASEITAIAGYAGSGHPGPTTGHICYDNAQHTDEYSSLGYAEAVQLSLPQGAIGAAATTFFNTFVDIGDGIWAREDYRDQGPQFRALIALPGGIDSALMPQAMNSQHPPQICGRRAAHNASCRRCDVRTCTT